MPLQGFVDNGVPTIKAAWLNAIDAFYFTLFNSATTAAQARTALGVSATGTDLPLAGGTMTGPINETAATVASHATTGDIWTPGNVILWTGTQTTTAFPAAPIAGARRLLRCSAGCAFTAGANLYIEGVATGSTVTMQADALVWVVAITTTLFKLTYSFSGNYTATATGFSTAVTTVMYYTMTNGHIHLTGSYGALTGTSNATTFTVTGMPAAIRPLVAKMFAPLLVQDNGVYTYTGYCILGTNGTMTITPAVATAWTGSGTKTLMNAEFSYGL